MGTLSAPPASEGSSAEKNQARSVPPALSTMAPSTIRSVAVGSSAPVHAVFQSASAPEAAFPVAASAPAAAGCSCFWGLSLRAFLRGDGAARPAPAPSATTSAPAATAAMTLDFPCIGFSYLAVSAQLKLPMPLAIAAPRRPFAARVCTCRRRCRWPRAPSGRGCRRASPPRAVLRLAASSYSGTRVVAYADARLRVAVLREPAAVERLAGGRASPHVGHAELAVRRLDDRVPVRGRVLQVLDRHGVEPVEAPLRHDRLQGLDVRTSRSPSRRP